MLNNYIFRRKHMISFVKGIVEDLTDSSVIIDHNGIGLEVFMSGKDLSQIRIGRDLKVYTYFYVKEDGMQLYGFLSKDDLNVYRMLLGVSGIGPKGAISILSGISADELRFAVLADDAGAIAKAPGIGKKTAQKIILELKDKFSLSEAFESKLSGASAAPASAARHEQDEIRKEAVEALTALGYSSTEALRAVSSVQDAPDVESLLKAALRKF